MNKIQLIHLAPSYKCRTGIASHADIVDQIFQKYLYEKFTVHRVDENTYLDAIKEYSGTILVLAQIGSNEGSIFRALLQQQKIYPNVIRIIEIHDPPYFAISYMRFLEKISQWLLGRVFRRFFHIAFGDFFVKRLISSRDTFICKTEVGLNALNNKLKKIGLNNHVAIIELPNYLDLPISRTNLNTKPPCIGFFGYIHPDKGLHVLVNAAIHLAMIKGIDSVPLIMIHGEITAEQNFNYLENLKSEIKKAELEDKVIFGDFIPFDILPKFLDGLTAIALPYMVEGRSSGSGPLLWARTCGVPVLAHKTQVFKEYIEDKIDGLLIPINDIEQWANILEKIAKEPNWGLQFNSGIMKKQSQTSWNRVSKIYDQLISDRVGRK